MVIRFGLILAVFIIVTEATIFGNGPGSPCPINKVARDQRDNQDKGSSRTFGHLLGEGSDSDLDYDDDDCYGNEQQFPNGDRPNQLTQDNFFGNFFPNMFGRPPNLPQRPQNPYYPPFQPTFRPPQYYPSPVPTRRPIPNRPRPTRPPQGGYFGNNNNYDPQNIFNPSNNIKPVHENTQETYQPPPYYPSVIGGSMNQIIGVSAGSIRPRPDLNRPRPDVNPRPRPEFSNGNVRPRPGNRMDNPNPPRAGIIGSFVDLLF